MEGIYRTSRTPSAIGFATTLASTRSLRMESGAHAASGSFRRRLHSNVPAIKPGGDVRLTNCSRRRLDDPFGGFIDQPMHNDGGGSSEVSAFHPPTDVAATRFT